MDLSDQLVAHLLEKWGNEKPCPFCGEVYWGVPQEVYALVEYRDGAIYIGGSITPILPITCANCGNTALTNPVAAGLGREEEVVEEVEGEEQEGQP